MTSAGSLDREVTILAKTTAQEATYGTKQASWSPLDTVWAEVADVLPPRGDRVAGEITITRRNARIRMRWRDDVSQANRIELDGRQMRIISGPAMLGRRHWLEIMVEELSTEGQQQ